MRDQKLGWTGFIAFKATLIKLQMPDIFVEKNYFLLEAIYLPGGVTLGAEGSIGPIPTVYNE